MIQHVAIKRAGCVYQLPRPNRHFQVEKLLPGGFISETDTKGFLDSTGKFLTRREAFVLAIETKQLTRSLIVDTDELYSEDLW